MTVPDAATLAETVRREIFGDLDKASEADASPRTKAKVISLRSAVRAVHSGRAVHSLHVTGFALLRAARQRGALS